MHFKSNIYILILFGFLTGCASLPSDDDLKAFSDASSKGTTAVKTAVTSATLVADRYDQEKVAQRFLMRQSMTAFNIPKKQTRISSDAMAGMLNALDNLAAYTEAIGKAADQKNVDDLEAAAANLGKAAEKLAESVPTPAGQLAGPALAVGGRLMGYALADDYTRKILTIIRKNDATVGKLVDLMSADLGLVSGDLEFQVGDYTAEREHTIRLIRQDSRVDRAVLYDQYVAARSDIAANEALLEAVSDGQKLLEKIRTTHHKLATGDRDIKTAVARFEATSDDLATLITAVKKESGQ